MSDPVPAVIETEATGETARIFADIRETLGSPVVNLIWRHLATVEGGLEWAWTAARPIYASRQAQSAAARLYARLEPPLPCPLPERPLPVPSPLPAAPVPSPSAVAPDRVSVPVEEARGAGGSRRRGCGGDGAVTG